MAKKSKTLYYNYTPQELFQRIKNVYLNKYYNIFMNSME